MRPSHAFTCLLCLGALPASLAAQVRAPVRVNPGGVNNNGPNRSDGLGVAAGGGLLAVAWAEQGGTSEALQDVHVAVSDDDGRTWSTPTRADTGEAAHLSDSEHPQVLVLDDGTVIVAWADEREAAARGGSTDDLLGNRSLDGGASWDVVATALNGPTSGANVASDVDLPWLAAAGAQVYAVWEEDTWSGPQGPEELWFTRSLDRGASWETARVVGSNGSGADVDGPKVAASGSRVVIAVIEDSGGGDDVWALVSNDSGATFSRRALESETAGDVDDVVLAMDGELVAIAWLDDEPASPGGPGVHASISTDGGTTFAPERSLTPLVEALSGASVFAASVAVRGASVVVVHVDDAWDVAGGGSGGANAGRAASACSQDGGASWRLETALEPGGATTHRRPALVVSSDRFYLHLESGASGSNRLLYSLSPDEGRSWSRPVEPPGLHTDVDAPDLGAGLFLAATEGVALSGFWDQTTGSNEVWVAGLGREPLVLRYCDAAINSTGVAARLDVRGSHWLADRDLRLEVEGAPDRPGVFFSGRRQGAFPFGNGSLCAIAPFHWIWPPRVPQAGHLEHLVDFGRMGIDGGRWNFQYWYRDPDGAGARFSTSDAISVWFQ